MTNYQKPTSEQVDQAVRRLLTPQLRRAFFEGLKNPLWLEPLAEKALFANPPEPEKTDDGLIRDVYWPELDYLIRVARQEPAAVIGIISKLSASSNSWVRRAAFTIGAVVPAGEAARLKTVLKAWLPTGWGWRSDPREMVDFACNLLDGGEVKTGRWVADVLFRPGPAGDSRDPKTFLEDYWYEDGLPRVVEALGDDGLYVVLPWLTAYERESGRATETSDFTALSRDSIRRRSGLSVHGSVEQSLIDGAREAAVKAMLVDPAKAKTSLLASRTVLTRKLALFAAAAALESARLTEEGTDRLVTVATELLFDDESRDDSCRIEYGELARAVAHVDRAALEPLSDFLARGPSVAVDELRERLRMDPDETPDAVEERVETYLSGWKHRWFAAIGADALPADVRPVLAELDASLGVIEDPLAPPVTSMSWGGPNSPVSVDEMAAMRPTELLGHLESWRYTGQGWGPEPSHEGQGRELTRLLTTTPMALAGTSELVDRLRPTYLRAILQGWEAALKADLVLDWGQTSDLIKGVLAHSDKSDFPLEGRDFDDDRDFRWAKAAAVSLLVQLVRKRENELVPSGALEIFAELLITDAADEAAWTEYDADRESGMDPLTMSLNWQWPVRLRGLIYLAGHGADAPWAQAALAALEIEVARTDKHGAGRAVLGEGLGRLLVGVPVWLNARLEQLVGSDQGVSTAQQIVLSTAIATHHYHKDMYDLLSDSMVAAVKAGGSLEAGWRREFSPLQRIGEWAIDALIYGHKTFDDPLVNTFFSSADPAVRGDSMGRVAWSLFHAERVDKTFRDRFAHLWDERIRHVEDHPDDREELKDFYWLAKGNKFATEWWLPRLRTVIELEPDIVSSRFIIGKELAQASGADPKNALAVLQQLLGGHDQPGMVSYDLTQNAAAVIIANAIRSGDDDLKGEAEAYMNKLGSEGYLTLKSEVDAVLEGSVTVDDVE